MKKIIFVLIISAFTFLKAQEYDRNILVEVFTNSHCPQCPPAHAALDSYLANGSGKANVRYIFYNIRYPYSDDLLFQNNISDADGRNDYYGPFFGTPVGFVDGVNTGYSSWAGKIDSRIAVKSAVQINLSGNIGSGSFTLNADISVGSGVGGGNVINFVVVEDVIYAGRNGVNLHKHVMRMMIGSPSGESIDLSSNKSISKTIELNSNWKTENLGVVVFVQNSATKEVYQSEFISYNELSVTDISDKENVVPYSYKLAQNYPNPFNPTTTIEYEIPNEEHIVLKIYDILGKEVTELVNSKKSSGKYSVEFNAENLSSGIYYYTIRAGKFFESRKLVLLK